jgi:hypothetical protein
MPFSSSLTVQDARLAALSDGLHDIGGQIGEPKQPADMGVAQPKALCNLGGIDELNVVQRAHPRPCAREREYKRLIDPTRLRPGIARNEYLLALATTGRWKRTTWVPANARAAGYCRASASAVLGWHISSLVYAAT